MTILLAGFHLRPAERSEAELLFNIMLRRWTGTVAPNSSAYRETEKTIASQLDRGGAVILFEGNNPLASPPPTMRKRFKPVSDANSVRSLFGDPRCGSRM